MKLLIGLGNPGKKYEDTRHNIGFQIINKLKQEYKFPEFTFSKKHNADISEGILNNERLLLAKPQTFMNNSGKAVKSLIKNAKDERLIVIHDDIDLPVGSFKISENRGSAGHKGVDSIIKFLGTKNFARIRIGIQPKTGKPKRAEDFVLKKPAKEEKESLEKVIEKVLSELGE